MAIHICGAVGVVLGPHLDESVDVQLRQGQIVLLGLAHECVDHDGDEQIQEDLGHDHLEQEEVDDGVNAQPATFDYFIIVKVRLVFVNYLVCITLERDVASASQIIHQ